MHAMALVWRELPTPGHLLFVRDYQRTLSGEACLNDVFVNFVDEAD
jgi:hypothetical protein